MSKFTTETRYICETYADMDSQAGSINDTIEKSIPYIFTDDWTTYDPAHKPELCKKILRHYWMREIGFETVGLWKLELNEYLAEIMPKYNRMWENLEPIKADLLNNGDITETKDLAGTHDITNDNKGSAHTEGGTTNTQNTTGTDHTEGSTTDTTGQTSKSHATSSGSTSSSSDGWQEANDTPQGGLDGIEARRYLSSAVHNRGTNGGKSEQTSDSNSSVDTTDKITNTQDEKTTEGINGSTTNTQDSNTTENKSEKEHHDESYILKIKGKNNGSSYIDEYIKLMNQYEDIDRLIIRDLNVCFMGLWE